MEQIVEVARTPARGPRFPRLHPPEDDPRRRSRAGAAGRALRRPRVDQRRAADRRAGSTALAPEKDAAQIEGAMGDMKASIADAGDAAKRFKSAPRFAPAGQSTQMIVGADARERRATSSARRARSTTASACGASIIRPSARSPTPARVLPLQAAAADARAPALPGRLADALLRLRAERGAERGRRRTACCRSTSIPSSPGR